MYIGVSHRAFRLAEGALKTQKPISTVCAGNSAVERVWRNTFIENNLCAHGTNLPCSSFFYQIALRRKSRLAERNIFSWGSVHPEFPTEERLLRMPKNVINLDSQPVLELGINTCDSEYLAKSPTDWFYKNDAERQMDAPRLMMQQRSRVQGSHFKEKRVNLRWRNLFSTRLET